MKYSQARVGGGWIAPLDGIRGVAVLLVLLFHYGTELNRGSVPQRVASVFCGFGWTGVDLFFVLSGFLITGILLDSKGASNYFSSFYMRRVLRIFPLYYATLLIVFVLMPGLFHNQEPTLPPRHDRFLYLVYLQNWVVLLRQTGQRIMAQYWSLAVEEQFYLIWPVVVAICTRKRLVQIAIGGSVVAVLLRLGFLAAGTDPEALYRNTFTRMDSLLIGAVCSILIRNEAGIEWVRRHRVWLGWLPVAVLGGLHLAVDPFKNIAPAIVGTGFSLIALSYAGLLLSVVASAGSGSVLDRAFANPILRAFGKYSYAAYLLQFLGRNLVLNNEARLRVRSPGPVNILLEIGVTFALSFASYFLLERHFLVWKRRFDPRLPALSTKAALAAN